MNGCGTSHKTSRVEVVGMDQLESSEIKNNLIPIFCHPLPFQQTSSSAPEVEER